MPLYGCLWNLMSPKNTILPMTTLWIDADAAPRDVKEICFRASDRLAISAILVANQRIQLPPGYQHLSAVRVEGGPDVADRYIIEHAVAGDIAITADIPLAAALVGTGVVVLDPRGDEYTAEIIGERLSVRNFMDGLRGLGVETGGPATYGVREKQAFANALDRALTRLLKQRPFASTADKRAGVMPRPAVAFSIPSPNGDPSPRTRADTD